MNNQNKRLIVLTIFLLCLGTCSIKAQTLINQSDRPTLQMKESMEKVGFSMQSNYLGLKETKANNETYLLLDMGQDFTTTKEVGSPQLPVYNRLIEIPYGAEISIKYSNIVKETYDLSKYSSYKIMPKQKPVFKSDSDSSFVINNKIYSSDKYFGQDLVTVEIIGIMGSVRLARVSISPVRYNPQSNMIEVVKSFCAEISFPKADIKATIKAREKAGNTSFIENKILNNKNLTSISTSSVVNRPLKLVVVSDTMFRETLAPFLAWKRQQGFNVVEAYIGENGITRDTNSIRTYLSNIYTSATATNPAADYLLLCGDVNLVPTFSGAYQDYSNTEYFPTDLYYAEYPGDYLPDLFYGRFSAQTTSQMQSIVDKTMKYEKYEMPDTTHLSKVLLIAGKETGSNAPTYGNGQINYVKGYVMSQPNTDTLIYYNPASGNYSSQIHDSITLNGYGLINYSAHCSEDGWYSPSLLVDDINNNINNTGKYPLFIDNCCLSNKFSVSECFGEAVLRATNKGGVGAIGGSCYTYWDGDYYWSVGAKSAVVNPSYNANQLGAYDRLYHKNGEDFSKWNITAGQLIQAGDLAVLQANVGEDEYYFQIYHMLGDPTLIPYIGLPSENTHNIPQTMPIGSNAISFITAPYSYVGVSKNGTLLGASQADSLGNVNIAFASPISEEGYVNVVITSQFKKPIIDSVLMISPAGAFISVNSFVIKDSLGTIVTDLKNNEEYTVSLTLKNLGSASLDSVSVALRANNAITLIDSVRYIGLMQSGNDTTINNIFSFRVKEGVENSTLIPFVFNISGADNYANTKTTNLVVKAPNININNIAISAPNGFSAGQDITLKFKVQNIGANRSSAGTINVTNLLTNLSCVSDSVFAFSSLNNDSLLSCNLSFHINSLSLAQTEYLVVRINAIAGNYGTTQIDSIPLKYNMETFESGNLSNFNWTYTTHPWYIDTIAANAYEGSFSLRSAAISNSQTSSITLSARAMHTDTISFYIKVSSEEGYDIASFYIDGSKQLELSGTKSWQRYAFVVDSGSHTYKWEYSKDGYVNAGSDAVWIDNVSLPALYITSSLNDAQVQTDNVMIYPNPAKDRVYIKNLSPESSVVLFDALGQAVVNQIMANTMNISYLPNGVYYMQIKKGNSLQVRKLIIAR